MAGFTLPFRRFARPVAQRRYSRRDKIYGLNSVPKFDPEPSTFESLEMC